MRYRTTITYDTGRTLTATDTAALAAHVGAAVIVTAGPDSALTFDHTVEHTNVVSAVGLAVFDTAEAMAAVGIRNGETLHEPIAATATEEDRHTAQTVRPGMPGTVTITETAPILGVSQQRASQLATTDPNFPTPINPGREPRLYAEQAMRDYAASRPRGKGGRPKNTTS